MSAVFQRTFDSLRSASYRPFFLAFLVAMLGFWTRIATVGWLVYEITGSREALGDVTAASLLPFVVFAPWGGALADRLDGRRMIAFTMGSIALLNVAFAIWLVFHEATLEAIFAYTILVGALRGLEVPARQALLVRLVGKERLHNAIGLGAASFHFTAAFGPVLAGLLYHFVGPAVCFAFVAATALPIVFVAPRLTLVAPGPPHDGASVRSDLLEGFRYVLTDRRTRALFLAPSVSILLLWSFRTLMPAVAHDVLGLEEIGYGLLMGTLGVGSLLGALFVASGATKRIDGLVDLLPFALVGAASVAVVGIATSPLVAGLGLVVTGLCQVSFLASANTQVQMAVPDRLRARVMGVWALSFGLCWPLGSLVMGRIAEWRDTELALLAGAGVTALCVVPILVLSHRRRQRSREAT